jgi:hypothetical protein
MQYDLDDYVPLGYQRGLIKRFQIDYSDYEDTQAKSTWDYEHSLYEQGLTGVVKGQKLVHLPRCPKCKGNYRLMKSDDPEFTYMLRHDTHGCSYQYTAYHDVAFKLVEEVRDYFKKSFPWKYKETRKMMS